MNRTNRTRFPLRKIVGVKTVPNEKSYLPDSTYELLECGHLGYNIRVVGSNIYGPAPAGSRRCRHCYRELSGGVQ